jgi:hypothetical protein
VAGESQERARRQAAGLEPRDVGCFARRRAIVLSWIDNPQGRPEPRAVQQEGVRRTVERIRVIPDGPEREQLFYEGKRMLVAYMPYKYHVHRILTDLAWPWLHGFRRPPYWQAWWQFVDIDAEARARATQ